MLNSSAFRVGASVFAMAVLVLAFLVLRPEDDPGSPVGQTAVPAATMTAPSAAATTTVGAAAPRPASVRLVADRVRRIEVRRGDVVRLQIENPTAEELHVHGYDLSRELPAGEPVRMQFVASTTGVFEIELEGAGRPVAELTVLP